MPEPIHPFKFVSVLLQYPEPVSVERVKETPIEEIGPVSAGQGRELSSFLAWYRPLGIDELRRAYVDAFDFERRSSLHLTYQLHGDSRQRGLALLKIKSAYRRAGLEPEATELPDFLPLMLEFAALAPEQAGIELIGGYRESIELVKASLERGDSPWSPLLRVVTAGLPGLTSRQVGRIKRLAEQGPPSEEVGMEPFAPPEVMPTQPGDVPLPLIGGRK